MKEYKTIWQKHKIIGQLSIKIVCERKISDTIVSTKTCFYEFLVFSFCFLLKMFLWNFWNAYDVFVVFLVFWFYFSFAHMTWSNLIDGPQMIRHASQFAITLKYLMFVHLWWREMKWRLLLEIYFGASKNMINFLFETRKLKRL